MCHTLSKVTHILFPVKLLSNRVKYQEQLTDVNSPGVNSDFFGEIELLSKKYFDKYIGKPWCRLEAKKFGDSF